LTLRSFKYTLINWFLPLGYFILRFYLSTLKIRVVGEEIALGCLSEYGRLVVAIWHQRFLPALAYVTKFKNFKPIVMISQSRDGEMIARFADRLGLVAVRGSSRRGGTTALREITETLKANTVVIHIVDGPTGPKGLVKPGLISMAQITGAVILPVIVSAQNAWVLGSWDRFLVPKPFSEVTIEWGQPFIVPRDLDSNSFEELRQDIETNLAEGYAEADLNSGWHEPL